jgi:hypothetical protein
MELVRITYKFAPLNPVLTRHAHANVRPVLKAHMATSSIVIHRICGEPLSRLAGDAPRRTQHLHILTRPGQI